jgi:hypothetical protein
MNDGNTNLVNLLPAAFGCTLSLPQVMNAIGRGELHPVTGRLMPRPPAPPVTAVVDSDIANWQAEKRQMHAEMRQMLLAKSYRATDPEKIRRLTQAAHDLQGE